MSKKDLKEFRFAVGSKTGLRSTIWKCWVHGSEVYITGHLFGTQAKISLHSTGECQWSFMENWVLENTARRNTDRHIAKWNLTYPKDNNAVLAFRIGVPVSELRIQPVRANQKKTFWVNNAPSEATVEFCFYFTRPLESAPSVDINPQLRHLASLPLLDGRWLVSFVWFRSLSAPHIAAARDAAIEQANDSGAQVDPIDRIALFALPTSDTSAAILEVSATDS